MQLILDALKVVGLVVLQMQRRWYLVLACVLASLGLTIAAAQVMPPKYTTTMTVTAPPTSGSSLSNAASMLAGSSSLLGLNLGGGQASQFDSYLALLKSSSVASDLIRDPKVMQAMFGKALDPATGEWRRGPGRRATSFLMQAFGVQPSSRPTVDDVQYNLDTMLVVNVAPLNRSMATVSCIWRNPDTCHDVMVAADRAAQARLDAIALANAQHMTKYLEDVVSKANEITLRQSLTTVMATTEAQMVLSAAGGQSRAVVLDPPIVPFRPSFPKPAIMLALALFCGLSIGGALTWLIRETEFDRAVEATAVRFRLQSASREA